MVFHRINCGILGLFRVCAIICFYGLCLFRLCSVVRFDQMSLASSSLPCVLGSVLKFWRPSWQLLGCSLPGLGSWSFVFLFWVLLRLVAEGLLLVGSVPYPAVCSSLLCLLWRSWRVIGAVPWVVLVLWSWRAFSFRSPPLLSSTSQGCMPFPVCHGECSGGSVRVSSLQGAVRPVSSSPGFSAAVWSLPWRQIGGVPFFFFLRVPFVGSVILSVGVAQTFFFTLFLGAFVSLRSSEASFLIHSPFGFGLLAALHGFLRLLTSLSVFLHQFWRLCM